MLEVFKDVVGFEQQYEVSNLGRIRNKKTGLFRKYQVDSWGYHTVKLGNNKKYIKTMFVHQIVALAFLPKLDNKFQINHKDYNKLNNNLENLEWVTPKENNTHAWLNPKRRRKYRVY